MEKSKMKKNPNVWLLLFAVGILFGVLGCIEDNTDTLIPTVTPYLNTGDIPAYLQDSMLKHGMVFYTGITPPVIEGSFLVSPFKLLYASDGKSDTTKFFDELLRFYEQSADKRSIRFQSKTDNSLSFSDTVKVYGSGSNFTAYFITNTTSAGTDYFSKLATIISGTMTTSGIRDIRYAITMVSKYDPSNFWMPVGTFRIFKDNDGFSENFPWSKIPMELNNNQPNLLPIDASFNSNNMETK
jgi:hypothetical protein